MHPHLGGDADVTDIRASRDNAASDDVMLACYLRHLCGRTEELPVSDVVELRIRHIRGDHGK